MLMPAGTSVRKVGSSERIAVLELHSIAQREGVGESVGARGPLGGQGGLQVSAGGVAIHERATGVEQGVPHLGIV